MAMSSSSQALVEVFEPFCIALRHFLQAHFEAKKSDPKVAFVLMRFRAYYQ